MDPVKYFDLNILSVLGEIRGSEDVLEYSKIEGDEFLKLPEKGFYLHSKDGNGVIFDCRIYFMSHEEYSPSGDGVRGRFASIATVSDIEELLGPCTREIRSFQVPTRPATLPGKEFSDGPNVVKAFFKDGGGIAYIHISRPGLTCPR